MKSEKYFVWKKYFPETPSKHFYEKPANCFPENSQNAYNRKDKKKHFSIIQIIQYCTNLFH